MANFNLDRIRFRWKSDWLSATAYTKDDIVYYRGKAYVCLIGHTSDAANLTTDLNNASPRWELMFDGTAWKNLWTSETYYTPGDIVKFAGYIYECTIAHTSTNVVNVGLPASISNWKIVATPTNWLNEWTVDTYYNLGDVVRYNGITYICSIKHQAASTTALGLEDNQADWNILSTSDSWQTDWTVNTRYKAKDIVKYGAISYRCLTGHTSATTLALGLEDDQSKWEIFLEGVEYKTNWAASTRYKKYDIVKSGGALWRATQGHTSTTTLREDLSNWQIYVPGLEYEAIWESSTEYNKGDIVVYGGYSYTALTNNLNSVPSVNGIIQDTGDWEILVAGYRHLGDWSEVTSYRTGDVIRDQGYLYIAIGDNTNTKPATDNTKWTVLVTGRKWKSEWIDDIEYHLGDVATYAGVAYICISDHLGTESDNRPDLDILNTNDNYWSVLLQGTSSNVLTTLGDLRTHDGTSHIKQAIGSPGSSLTSSGSIISWIDYETVDNVFYVSIDGIDNAQAGKSLNTPFRTVKYACQHVLSTIDTNTVNTTIFIKTGIYEEILPIKVPRNCALVGDELRSTVILPTSGYETGHMFFVNNGSGIRNMTLQGLAGDLPDTINEYGSKRPSGGAFVSLDPGTGPDDTSVHIINKSAYIQNVTAFGTACIGMKIDGNLHSSGNRSIVANDFTQVISDGIGYWAINTGRSELVSVFTYFCYIGYLAENGGIMRATNGNNSYGTYGSRSEGFSLDETPITAQFDNRTLEAQIDIVHTDGNKLIATGYSHAGQQYSNATVAIAGTGINAVGEYSELRNGGISQIRRIDPSDSSTPGGINYQFLLNSAQGGNQYGITLAASDDTGTSVKYVGMRIFIDSGKGVGQYAYISGYDPLTKIAIVSKESDDSQGWDHIYPGYPIATVLDSTTRYKIEPAVNVAEPTFSTSVLNTGTTANTYKFTASDKNQKIIVVPSDLGETISYSLDAGTSWINLDSVFRVGTNSTGAAWTGQEFIITSDSTYRYTSQSSSPTGWTEGGGMPANHTGVASDGAGNVVLPLANGSIRYSSDHGSNYSVATGIAGLPAYGHGKFIIVNNNGNVAYSTDDGANWTTTTSALSTDTWTSLVYGDGKFVVIGSANKVAYSHDGITWYETIIEDVDTFNTLSYGAGVFVATGNSNNLAKSQDGSVWKTYNSDSTSYALDSTRVWGQLEYMPLTKNWIAVAQGATWNTVQLGATAFARVNVSSSRIQEFIIYNPGSNYTSDPLLSVYDPEATVNVMYDVRLADGVLPQPVLTNRGTGYVTATATVTGNGFADIYQTGKVINLKNVSLVPGPGANVVINGIDDINYRLTKITSQSGSAPNFDLTIEVSPPLTNENSPNHEETLIMRELYSQVRLTGHDFLDIGSGNTTSTAYPQLYLEGYVSENEPQPFNEVTQFGGGRVFYTSTDQDGNFRVGELFAVEQATGVVSINADFFELSGLEELSLGGVQLGGSSVVIREFSKEQTFAANSNNIVPTERAIKEYLTSRISGGGADAVTNTLFAGQVKLTSNNITTTSGLDLNIPVDVNMTKGIDGDYLAQVFFTSGK